MLIYTVITKFYSLISNSLTFTKLCYFKCSQSQSSMEFFLHFTRKMRKIAISLQRYVWDPQNLARWRRTCLSSTLSVKSLIFKIQYGGRPLCYGDPFCIIMRCHDWRLSALIWTYNRCGKISVKNSQSSGNSARKPRREGVIFFWLTLYRVDQKTAHQARRHNSVQF